MEGSNRKAVLQLLPVNYQGIQRRYESGEAPSLEEVAIQVEAVRLHVPGACH